MNWKELRLAAAVKLFELGKLSSGAAARLAVIPRTLFLTRLANYVWIPFNWQKKTSRQRQFLPEVICNTSPLQYLHQIGQKPPQSRNLRPKAAFFS